MKAVAGIAGAVLFALLGALPAAAPGQCCGDCNGDGVATVDELMTAVNHALTGCADDGICSTESSMARLAGCQSDLGNCRAQAAGRHLPASGQTTSYGPGSDGAVRAGAVLAYTENGDGTVTDHVTGLMWEKKDDSGGIHDVDNEYTWSGASIGSTNVMDGTIATTFLATLNAGAGFAGYSDWRIPNIKELQSIVNYETTDVTSTVDAVFHQATTCTGCTDVTLAACSCAAPDCYWTSTTYPHPPIAAWNVHFLYGLLVPQNKDAGFRARAVRGGF